MIALASKIDVMSKAGLSSVDGAKPKKPAKKRATAKAVKEQTQN